MTRQDPSEQTASKFRLAGMGAELAGAVIGGGLIGYFIDYKFDTGHTGLIIGLSVGIIGGLYNLVRQSLKVVQQEQKQAEESGNDVDASD